ncbi:MAG: histidine phosphatase family protein [Mycobacteriales bacterium]|nr:MAG: hypothetical protein DLM56_06650 [Pseudonocardiales bacterium]
MTRTVVHLLRHGEVENPSGVLYGRLPGYHLSDRGREMAEAVARHLAARDVTHLVSSPLERAQETASPLATALNLTPVIDQRLIEADNYFQGGRFGIGANGVLRDPVNWWRLRNPMRPSWGEPYTDIAQRTLDATADARVSARGHQAVCVTHQLPIWVTRRALSNQRLWHDPRKRQCGLASLTTLTYDDDRLVSIGYAEPAGATPPDTTPGA